MMATCRGTLLTLKVDVLLNNLLKKGNIFKGIPYRYLNYHYSKYLGYLCLSNKLFMSNVPK